MTSSGNLASILSNPSSSSDLIRSVLNSHRMYCLSLKQAHNSPCKADKGELPRFHSSWGLGESQTHPNLIFMNDGYWDFANMVDNEYSLLMMKLLYNRSFGGSRAVWLTHYNIRLDIMKKYDLGHYMNFTNNSYSVPYATTAIAKTNEMRINHANQLGIPILELHKLADLMDLKFDELQRNASSSSNTGVGFNGKTIGNNKILTNTSINLLTLNCSCF